MGDIEVVVTDLDGTLWHTSSDIHPSVVPAMRELERRGLPLLVATGRRAGSTRAPLARMGFAPPAVVLNGALGLDLSDDSRFHRMPFPSEQAKVVLEAFEAEGLSPCIYVDHPRFEVLVGERCSTHPDHLRNFGSAVGTDDTDRVVAEETVLGFGLIGLPHGELVTVSDALDDEVEPHLDRSLDYPGLATITIAPRRQSKWDGVLSYCTAAGIDPTRVLAIGDGSNDLELLAGASIAVVPERSHPGAAKLADHRVPAPEHGGWAQLLDLL